VRVSPNDSRVEGEPVFRQVDPALPRWRSHLGDHLSKGRPVSIPGGLCFRHHFYIGGEVVPNRSGIPTEFFVTVPVTYRG
jgi:hypothetical protein